MKIKQFFKEQFTNCMTLPEYNSRLVYLVTTLTLCATTVVLSIAFIFAKDKAVYPSMVMAVGGSGIASGVSKFMQKYGQAKQDAANPTTPSVPAQ